jgi:hypothetical protein
MVECSGRIRCGSSKSTISYCLLFLRYLLVAALMCIQQLAMVAAIAGVPLSLSIIIVQQVRHLRGEEQICSRPEAYKNARRRKSGHGRQVT